MDKPRARYGIAYRSFEEIDFPGEYSIVTFHTKDEKKAKDLAKCIVGDKNVNRCLLIIDAQGEFWDAS